MLLAVLAAGGFLVTASGLIPIKASSGHWAITEWFLHFAMKRSVSTHSLGIEPPALDEPRLISKGAGHYEAGCRPCHGSPASPQPKIPLGMTPHPPYLPPRISGYEPRELFYIVKHGVKFTGMPAWPAQNRDDEVWAVVAFLLVLPKLDAEGYVGMANAATGVENRGVPPADGMEVSRDIPQVVLNICTRCHGLRGEGGGNGAFPRLAGQRPDYLTAALEAYADDVRHSGIMGPIAAGLTPEEKRELGAYYANLAAPEPAERDREAATERGRAIARKGIPRQRVPACASCHGPSSIARNENYPVLAGQSANYLVLQLELFKQENRGGSAYAHLMHEVAPRLSADHMRDVAAYYESVPAESDLAATAGR